MYLRINTDDPIIKENVIELLKENKIPFDQFQYATQVFFDEEAKYRLEGFLSDTEEDDPEELDDILKGKTQEEFIEEYAPGLAIMYFNDDYVINGEALEDIMLNYIRKEGI